MQWKFWSGGHSDTISLRLQNYHELLAPIPAPYILLSVLVVCINNSVDVAQISLVMTTGNVSETLDFCSVLTCVIAQKCVA
jgi:hypothetical protein